ncbi:uncharacterized protein PHA67_014677 [Liasis olivaceus]
MGGGGRKKALQLAGSTTPAAPTWCPPKTLLRGLPFLSNRLPPPSGAIRPASPPQVDAGTVGTLAAALRAPPLDPGKRGSDASPDGRPGGQVPACLPTWAPHYGGGLRAEPLSSPDSTSPASSQTSGLVANSEPFISGKSEASGESEITSPVEPAITGVAPVSFAQADRSHTEESNGDMLHSDASNLGSFSLDPLPGDAQSGGLGIVQGALSRGAAAGEGRGEMALCPTVGGNPQRLGEGWQPTVPVALRQEKQKALPGLEGRTHKLVSLRCVLVLGQGRDRYSCSHRSGHGGACSLPRVPGKLGPRSRFGGVSDIPRHVTRAAATSPHPP